MTTSQKTREYWVDKAKGWAENLLTHPGFDGSPQLDEFNQVMDELLNEAKEREIWLRDILKPRISSVLLEVNTEINRAITEEPQERNDE